MHQVAKQSLIAEDVQAQLLGNYPFSEVVLGRLTCAQLLHGCVRIAAAAYGERWVAHIALILASVEERSNWLSLFPANVPLRAAIIQDETHWALLMVHKAEKSGRHRAVLYDSLQKDSVVDASTALLMHWFGNALPPIYVATVDAQSDDWTCGLRVLASFLGCLKCVLSSQSLPRVLPPLTCSLDRLQSLVQQISEPTDLRAEFHPTQPCATTGDPLSPVVREAAG